MAGLQMPKRGDGAAMLRELRDEERPSLNEAPEGDQVQATNGHAPVLTEVRTYGSTEARTEASTGGSKDALTDAGAQARKPARKQVRAEGSQEVRAPTSEDGLAGFLEVVDAALASREPLLGGVKATVDMSPALSTRAKRYLADHRGQNTRQVIVALLDAFLSAKGY